MSKQHFPLAMILVVWTAAVFAAEAPAAHERDSDENTLVSPGRLQTDRECFAVLEARASRPNRAQANPRELHAVLVNGDNSALHNENVGRAYDVLRTLGVPDPNIYVLSNSNPRPESCSAQPDLITTKATTGNVSNVLAYLNGQVDENDCLLIYATGHGVRQRGQSALVLNDGNMLEADMVKELKRMTPAVSVLIMDQCFSGGFADAVEAAGLDTITITDTDSRHETYCEYFAGAFWLSFLEPEADINSDGRISLKECYEVAMTLHSMALADTPERTRCRYAAPEGEIEPSVSLSRNAVTWENEPAALEERIITAKADEMPQHEIRQTRLAGHKKGYRPQ